MMRWYLRLLCLPFVATALAGPVYESSYTSLSEASCRTIAADESEITTKQHCPGFGPWGVIVTETDLRQSITLTRDGKEYPLAFWRTVSPAWSILGEVAEWRYISSSPDSPFAMIVRLNLSENPAAPDVMTSYLVISKLSETGICVVGKVPPVEGGQQNRLARDIADKALTRPCLSDPAPPRMQITP
jgi:hypothetical protein